MLIQSILLAIWAGICLVDERSFWSGTPRGILAGSIAGLIMGDMVLGVVISGTLQLMWLANVGIGAFVPPNEPIGAIVGVAVAIISPLEFEAAVTVGVAVAVLAATLGQQLIIFRNTINIVSFHRAEKLADTGDFDKVARWNYFGLVLSFFIGAIPVFIAVYFGGPAVENVLNLIPDGVIGGLGVASGLLPVVGIAMLLMVMMGKNMWIFLMLGFVSAAYLDLPIIAISIVGVCVAAIYDMIVHKETNVTDISNNTIDGEEDL